MPTRYFPSRILLAILFAYVCTLSSVAWSAPKYKLLHAFTAGKDGASVWGGLVRDAKGNLYGTAAGGGAYAYGIVFELTPHRNGKWTEQVLHSFQNNDSDGGEPSSTLILDGAGNLYGTTPLGGAQHWGTVFELTRGTEGWTEAMLHSFGFNSDGCCPSGGVIMDNAGNLFGNASVAFELSLGADGWKEVVLYHFRGKHDGNPLAALIMDVAGNLYGTTEHGGGSKNCGDGCGTVYQLVPTSGGRWKEHILHPFQALWDGAYPGGSLILDVAGNLYGTADGGDSGHGVIFKLSPGSDGHWKETVLYNLTGGANGDSPTAGVVMDKAGALYGTTIAGGDPNCDCGVVYKLAPGSDGKWTYTILHTFIGSDGAQPDAKLILDDKGNLYGTTVTGGPGGYGVAYELTP